jgi:ATP-dependent Lon protease
VLREQMRAIQNELGESGSVQSDAEELRKRLAALDVSDDVREKTEKEIARMEKLSLGSPELGVIRTYVEWILDLPWNKYTEDNLDLNHARRILDEDHYGLEKVKDRIIEYIAVMARKKDLRGPVLCLVARQAPAKRLSPVPSRARSGAGLCAPLSAASVTKPKSGVTAAHISARFPAASSLPSSRRKA